MLKMSDSRERAFALQFLGKANDISARLGLSGDVNPTEIIEKTGLFGVLDALFDLKLNGNEIKKFYYHGYLNTKPNYFIEDIIKIVYGVPKDKIKEEYGYYFDDATIERISNPSINTRMLLSFCYDANDIYIFIPSEEDLQARLLDKYKDRYALYYKDEDYNYEDEEKFQKIDGRLFRAIHFLVRQGYDFPKIESLFNENIKDIDFKQTNGEKKFILDKEYASKISDDILSMVRFFEKNNYKILNPEYMFDLQCNDITLIDSNGKQTILNRAYLASNIDRYILLQDNLSCYHFQISDITSLCDKRVENIELKYYSCNYMGETEQRITVKRSMLDLISLELLKTMSRAYENGLTFSDNDNLFDSNQKLLKVADANGKEYLVIREQFDSMLEIIIKCKESNFSVNLEELFNTSQSDVELIDKKGKKGTVCRDKIIFMMDVYKLLTENGFSFDDYSSLFDEKQQYITCCDKQNKEVVISRKQINKIIKIKQLSYEEGEKLTDGEKDLSFMLDNYNIRNKLFEWLPYTAKKWIPSSAVINKIPAEKSYEYFYNNNHTRLQLLKDIYQPSNYDEMEGIVSLGYILGLFDSRESTSEKAVKYIIDYFKNKGITADELHTTYGAVDLRKDYSKNFADFFMYHYAKDSGAFIEPDLGTNMVGELFQRFDEVLESRPEKRIKTNTRNKLLLPVDAIAAITSVEIDYELLGEKANDGRYVRLAELLTKFRASKNELIWAIGLYEQALAIDEQKVKIPYIEDLNSSIMKFTSHLKSNPQAFLSGRKTNCCSKYGGAAQDRLTHVITDLDWRYVTFTSPNRTFFDGLVWYDVENKVTCIDNVEGQFSKIDKNNPEAIAMMADTIIRYADGIYCKMNELNIPCVKVNVGKDSGTASWEIFRYAMQQKLINEDYNPCNYPTRNGISTDAHNQFTITDAKTLCLRRKQ